MNKVEIRRQIIKQRTKVSKIEKTVWDEKIAENFFEVAHMHKGKSVLAFYPTASEPQIQNYMKECLLRGARLFLPRINGDRLDICEICDLEDVEQNQLQVFEPKPHFHVTDQTEFDVILVPGLAFTIHGDRVGFGRGFYDKLLANITGLKVGVAYEYQYNINFEAEPHDQKVDILVTNQNVYRFNL